MHSGETTPDDAAVFHPRKMVLIVDDEADLAEMMKLAARMDQHDALTAGTIQAARAQWAVQRDKVDLLIMDLTIERAMDGFDLASEFRRDRPTLKIVFTSGHPVDTWSDPSLIAGYNYLAKPFRLHDLPEIMRLHLTPQRTPHAVAV